MASKYEYFTGTDDSQYGPQSIYWYGQTFTIGAVGTDVHQIAYSVILKLAKVGDPSGNLTAAIRAVDGDGLPTGSNLCAGTKESGDLTTTPTNYELVFTSGTLFLPDTKYGLVVSCPTADGSNAPLWRHVVAGGYTGGSVVNSSNSGVTWAASETQDFMFEVQENCPSQDLLLVLEIGSPKCCLLHQTGLRVLTIWELLFTIQSGEPYPKLPLRKEKC